MKNNRFKSMLVTFSRTFFPKQKETPKPPLIDNQVSAMVRDEHLDEAIQAVLSAAHKASIRTSYNQ